MTNNNPPPPSSFKGTMSKAHSALQQAVDESNLFDSDQIIIDKTFNQKHKLSAYLDLPSPSPFKVNASTLNTIWVRFYEIDLNNPPSKFYKWFIKSGLQLTNFVTAYDTEIPIANVASASGLPVKKDDIALTQHSQRIRIWNLAALPLLSGIIPIIIGVVLVFLGLFPVLLSMTTKEFPPNQYSQFVISLSIVFLFIFILVSIFGCFIAYIVIPTRLLSRFWTKNFLDSICVREIIYLLFELKNQDSNTNHETRRNVQFRLNRLARYTSALAARFSSPNKNNQQWMEDHFNQMAAYIQERERWLLAPTPTTINDLQRDLRELAKIYISGNYGLFQWDSVSIIQPKPDSWWLSALKQLGRFMVFIVPIGLMIWLLYNTKVLSSLNLNVNTIIFLLIAWVLLGLDSALKLGVVSDLFKVAKGMRDLNK